CTLGSSLMTRETVLSDTWARSATSLMVGLRNEASRFTSDYIRRTAASLDAAGGASLSNPRRGGYTCGGLWSASVQFCDTASRALATGVCCACPTLWPRIAKYRMYR